MEKNIFVAFVAAGNAWNWTESVPLKLEKSFENKYRPLFTRIEHAWNKNCAKKVEAAKVTESCRDTFYCLYSGFVRCSFALSSFLTRESKEIYLQNLNNKRGMLNTRVDIKNISKRFYEERDEKCIFAYFIFLHLNIDLLDFTRLICAWSEKFWWIYMGGLCGYRAQVSRGRNKEIFSWIEFETLSVFSFSLIRFVRRRKFSWT